MGTFAPTNEYVKALGRSVMRNDIRWCAFSATGIEFVSRSKSVEITLYGDSACQDKDNCARYAIYVDGMLKEDRCLEEKVRKIVIADDKEESVHLIRVIKLSESAMSTMGIGCIEADNIIPTVDKEIFVEYIGDSITCGYGVDDEDPEHHFVTRTEDASKAFAYTSAKLMGVDYSLVSFSGYGVVSGYTADGVINTHELLPKHYEKLGFSYATSGIEGDEFKVSDIQWDFSGRKPEVVVINLGTNDMSYTGEDKEKQAMYKEKYTELVKTVRKNYPDCYILSILGVMGDLLYPVLREAVNEYIAATGDVRIETMPLEPIDAETEGYVADYHPRKGTHMRVAEQVADRVSQIVYREYGKILCRNDIALTFDDGPNTGTTCDVLDILEREGVPGTFFLIGKNINQGSSASVRRAVALGCEIENHSMTHPAMPELDADEIMAELEETSEMINRLTGKYPSYFRPPYIAVNDVMREIIPLTMISGYGCDDWDMNVSANIRIQKTLAQLGAGRIVLLHDMEGNVNTVMALPVIIERAKSLGYEMVKLEDLFDSRKITPSRGIVYNEAIR